MMTEVITNGYTYHYLSSTPPESAPQYRKRVKGFGGMCSWDNGEDEWVEVSAECPNISTGGIGPIDAGEVFYGWEYLTT